MLDLIRKKQKTTVVQVVFWVIIATFIGTIFLVWGKGNEQTREFTVAAEVNGTEISFDEFKSTYNSMYNFYRNIYGENFTPEMERQLRLPEQSINTLIDQTLLLQEADRLNLSVSKEELVQSIAAIPAFQVDGTFNKQQYLSVLTYQRLKPELFEQMQEQQILVQMTRQTLEDGVVVSDEDVANEFRRLNEKINLEYIPFAASAFRDQIKLSEAQIDAYYVEHQEQFRVAEQRALSFVQLDRNQYRNEVVVDEAEVQRYYERHLSQFEIQEQVAVAHILIMVSPDADEATVSARAALATSVLEKAQSGDFKKLAQQYSDDKATAANGGALGFFARGAMDPTFEEAAFALQAGELSAVIKSRFGYHIVKGQGRIEAGFKVLADVEIDVKEALITEESERLAYEDAMDAYNVNRKTGSLATIAEGLNLTVVETGLFERAAAIPAIGVNEDLAQRAFSTPTGSLIAPVRGAAGIYVCEVAETKETHIPELSVVKAIVEVELLNGESVVLAQQQAEQALAKVIAGTSLKSVAPKGVTLKETGLFSQTFGDFVPTLGNVLGLSEAAFSLTVKDAVAQQLFTANDTFYVVRLKQLQPADPAGLTAEESDRLRNAVLTTQRDELLKAKIEILKKSADVTIAPTILRSIEGN
jgi:peptidyl-prolyl cis-trans isomerase D